METQTSFGSSLTPNVAGALSYVLGFITGIVFLLTSKDKFVRFHAMQSIITSVAIMVLNIILGFTIIGLVLVPFLGLGSLALFIVLIIKAYQGEKFKLPVIGEYAEKNA